MRADTFRFSINSNVKIWNLDQIQQNRVCMPFSHHPLIIGREIISQFPWYLSKAQSTLKTWLCSISSSCRWKNWHMEGSIFCHADLKSHLSLVPLLVLCFLPFLYLQAIHFVLCRALKGPTEILKVFMFRYHGDKSNTKLQWEKEYYGSKS